MTSSVADRIAHRMPRPILCDSCNGPNVHLQKREFMGMRTYGKWDLIWHCGDCNAMVGCHEGTAIPFGRMADNETRAARYLAHQDFDALWRKKLMTRKEAYHWLARLLCLPLEDAHIGMLDKEQCAFVVERAKHLYALKPQPRNWRQNKRRKRK